MASEFDKRYPPDALGDEANENARVWAIGRERASEQDRNLVNGWNKSLDVLLIFAGLFSAVVTSFLVEVQKQLEPDYAKYQSLAFLALQRHGAQFVANEASLDPEQFEVPGSARFITGLWLVSLSLSLIVALMAILVKQWLDEHSSRIKSPAASHRAWLWRYLAYSRGLEAWHIDALVSTLPVALHAALFLYLAGLVVFFWPSSPSLAGFLLAITATTMAFYVITTLLPLVVAGCPTRTPLMRQLRHVFSLLLSGHSNQRSLVSHEEKRVIRRDGSVQTAQVLLSMVESMATPEEVEVAFDALSGLPLPEDATAPELNSVILSDRLQDLINRRFSTLLAAGAAVDRAAVGRLFRAKARLDRLHGLQGPITAEVTVPLNSVGGADLVAMCLNRTPEYRQIISILVNSAQPSRPYDPKMLPLLLSMDAAMNSPTDALYDRLQLRVRLLCFEAHHIAFLPAGAIVDAAAWELVRLLYSELKAEWEVVVEALLYNCDHQYVFLLVLNKAMRVYATTSPHPGLSEALFTSFTTLFGRTADWSGRPARIPMSMLMRFMDGFGVTMYPGRSWTLSARIFGWLVGCATGGVPGWNASYSRTVAATMAQLLSEDSNADWQKKSSGLVLWCLNFGSLQCGHTASLAGSSGSTVLYVNQAVFFGVLRTSAWRICCRSVPTDVPRIRMAPFLRQMTSDAVNLHRSGFDVLPLIEEMFCLPLRDETPSLSTHNRWRVSYLEVLFAAEETDAKRIAIHLKELLPPEAWDVVKARISAHSNDSWPSPDTPQTGAPASHPNPISSGVPASSYPQVMNTPGPPIQTLGGVGLTVRPHTPDARSGQGSTLVNAPAVPKISREQHFIAEVEAAGHCTECPSRGTIADSDRVPEILGVYRRVAT